jgi:hypothetical protein
VAKVGVQCLRMAETGLVFSCLRNGQSEVTATHRPVGPRLSSGPYTYHILDGRYLEVFSFATIVQLKLQISIKQLMKDFRGLYDVFHMGRLVSPSESACASLCTVQDASQDSLGQQADHAGPHFCQQNTPL